MPITTLIVDDTVTYRKILSEAAMRCGGIDITGTAPSGVLALKKMAQTPVQLVLLDIHMPDMDGVETLRRIKEDFPQTHVVMVSGVDTRGAETTIRALELGALDFIRKPESGRPEENLKRLMDDLRPIIRLVETRLLLTGARVGATEQEEHPRRREELSIITEKNGVVPYHFSVVAIGVSTGGPEALAKLLPQLPADLPVPVLLVQHMPPLFTKPLAESLARKTKLRVDEARDGQPVEPGAVYIAPGGRHMTVQSRGTGMVICLNDGPPENSCRPSVDVLFRSVAAVYGDDGVLATILTGMGGDGCSGVRALKRKNCFCITQRESSCVVYGMPKAIDEAGLSNVSLPIEEIAGEIIRRVKP